jgi:hypothetical protein
MISQETRARVLRLHFAEHWPIGTVARELGVHHDTVRRLLAQAGVQQTLQSPRPSKADPYLGFMLETLRQHPDLRASRLYQMVKERGYDDRPDHFRSIVARLRPGRPAEAFLRLRTLPGEQGQVDWAHFGQVQVGRARRKLYGFVLVLSWSRRIFLRFGYDIGMPGFIRSHVRRAGAVGSARRAAGRGLGGVASGRPARSCKSGAVTPRWAGSPCGFGENVGLAEVGAGAYTVEVLLGGASGGLEAGSARPAVAGTMGDGGLDFLRALAVVDEEVDGRASRDVGCAQAGDRHRTAIIAASRAGVTMKSITFLAWSLAVGASLAACSSDGCAKDCPGPQSTVACKASAECSISGLCSFRAGDCNSGACGVCEPAVASDCKTSQFCTTLGGCDVFVLGSGRRECAPATDADCAQSETCKSQGNCKRATATEHAPTCTK